MPRSTVGRQRLTKPCGNSGSVALDQPDQLDQGETGNLRLLCWCDFQDKTAVCFSPFHGNGWRRSEEVVFQWVFTAFVPPVGLDQIYFGEFVVAVPDELFHPFNLWM
jgi:hypothetical protein